MKATSTPAASLRRGVFCNRTLNLRSLKAIGYDMDYTLVHYEIEAWERLAFEAIRARFLDLGWPVANLTFEPAAVIRGLVVDREQGNLVKADRFGYVKRAVHGTRMLTHDEQRALYSRQVVDPEEERWWFLNTFFSLSEGCMYGHLVDLLDHGALPDVQGYDALFHRVRSTLDLAHMEGQLKAEVMADLDRYLVDDPGTARALLDQRDAGRRLLLITNSEWEYTRTIMAHAFDRHLPGSMTWRELFDLIVVGAGKPAFFLQRRPAFRIVDDSGLLQPLKGPMDPATGPYLGGCADLVEAGLGLSGAQILFVGDHVYDDVRVTKAVRRWRTAVVVRELESELEALESFQAGQEKLDKLMARKNDLERAATHIRLELQRRRVKKSGSRQGSDRTLQAEIGELRAHGEELEAIIAPLAQQAGTLSNPLWGLLMRTGADKSLFARKVENNADIYTSRVSNFEQATPFAYFRAQRGCLPHDPAAGQIEEPLK